MGNVCVISIYVKDLKQAAKFYSENLGLKVKKEMPYLTLLEHEGVDLVLSQAEESAAGNYPARSAVVLGFRTNDLAKRIKEFRSGGVNLIHSEPQDFPGGHFIAFRDPSGNALELLEFS